MPVKQCQLNGKPGFKWGDRGHCYIYDPSSPQSKERAHKQAAAQGAAIIASGGEKAKKD